MDFSFENSILELSDFEKLFGHTPGNDKITIKLALIGYPATGKTTFLRKFTDQIIVQEHIPSIDLELASEVLKMPNGTIVEVFIYDVPGQTLYTELPRLFSLGINGIIYFFAHHYTYSFRRLDYLLKFCDKYFLGDCHRLIVGNQYSDRENEIQPYEAYQYAGTHGIDYINIDLINNPKSVDQCVAYFIAKYI